jgi:tRNA pseudouridine38-40 synthase
MRIALGLEYDGTRFAGFQYQKNRRTVQEVLEQALERVADHPLRVVPAGRTDAGVHAREQVVHFDSPARRSPRAWREGANAGLPPDVSVLWAQEVGFDFHARRSATARCYRYRIRIAPARPALERGRVFWTRRSLDVAAMRQSLEGRLGEQDWSAFRSAGCQSHSCRRRVDRLTLMEQGDEVTFEIEANAFLYHMVRNLVGSLLEVGYGHQPPEWLGRVLAGRDRTAAGVMAPADGLYLWAIRYPEHYGLCQRPLPG